MASSPSVVRSLSADELASSLTRTNRPPPATPADAAEPDNIPITEQKRKAGLLKRLRRALRLNAQTARSPRPEKTMRDMAAATSPQTPPTYPEPDANDPVESHPRRPDPPQKPPTYRTIIWRGPLSSRNSAQTRHSSLADSSASSRRFMGLASDSSKKSPPANSTTNPDNAQNTHTAAGNAPPPQPSRSTLRSLPKRVVSSPPSLTGRTFGFTVGRKRNSVNGKPAQSRSGVISTLGEGDSDSIKKLERSLTARGRIENRGSMNLEHVNPNQTHYTPSPEHSADAFRVVIESATAGRLSFSDLLDAMFRLEEKLIPSVKDMLIKYLSRAENMEALIDQLTVIVPTVADDEGVEGPGGDRERYRYSYVSCMLLSNGPIQLRRSLFSNPKHLDHLVGVLSHSEPSDPVVVRSVCKVLLSVLRDSPEDTVLAMGRRSDFIDALLSHIAVTGCPEVCLSMLSTVRCQAELKFGPSNKPVVGMMADSKLVDTLCDKLADAAEKGPLDGTASSTIENCSRVIVGIALRALVIPRYEINGDDSDAAYMMKFNEDLASLDVFSEPRPILRLLDSGLKALEAHDTRGYALCTALTAVRYLLVTALNGQDSSLSTIRLQLMTVNTAAYEAGVRARIPKMAKVLENARNGVVVETMWERVRSPLGVVRLRILELIVVLLQHCSEATASTIASSQIPRILIELFVRLKLNSLLQHFVAAIVELSFTGKFSCLRRAFILDVRLLDRVMDMWDDTAETPDVRKQEPVNHMGELLRIVCAMHDFLFKQDSYEAKELKREVGVAKLELFKSFCEGPVAEKLKDNGTLLCGPGELPARPNDSFPVDGYSSMGGSQGPLFLKSRQGTAVNS